MSNRKLVQYQLLIFLGMVLCLECGIRLYSALFSFDLKESEPRQEWFTYADDLGWNRSANYSGPDLCGVHRAFDASGLLSLDTERLRNGPEKRKIVFLGDSNTYGYCVETGSTFVEVASHLVPDAVMVNLGVPGYTSFQGYKTLLKYGELIKPDVIFISFNFNDRRFFRRDGQPDSEAAFHQLASSQRTRQLLEYSYVFRLIDFWRTKIGASGNQVAKINLNELAPRVDQQNYRENLMKMVQWARQHGSTVMFILLGDSPYHTDLIREGAKHSAEKDYDAAVNYLTMAEERAIYDWSQESVHLLARVYLSRALKEKGEIARSDQLAIVDPPRFPPTVPPTPHGGFPIFLDVDYNQIMFEVANKYDVLIVDAKTELEKNPAVFVDIDHFDAKGHEIVARLLANALTRSAPSDGPLRTDSHAP